MQRPYKKIGILGGTFNPIHCAHLAMAQAAVNALKLDYVFFVPSFLPPHKSTGDLASVKDRYEMVKLAIKGNPKFRISKFEIQKGGHSYSIDTVKYFRARFSKTKVYFIIGQDSLNALSSWKEIDALVKLVEFVAVNRPGQKNIKSKYKVLSVPMSALKISSSQIRQRIAFGKSLRNFLPGSVIQYIEKRQLYQS